MCARTVAVTKACGPKRPPIQILSATRSLLPVMASENPCSCLTRAARSTICVEWVLQLLRRATDPSVDRDASRHFVCLVPVLRPHEQRPQQAQSATDLEHFAAVEALEDGTEVVRLLDLALAAGNHLLQVRPHLRGRVTSTCTFTAERQPFRAASGQTQSRAQRSGTAGP